MFPSPFLFSRARFSVIPFVFSCAQFPPFPSFCVFVRLNFFFSPLCSHATQFSPFPFEFSRTLISPFPFVFSCHPISLFSLFSFLFTPPGVPAPLIFPVPPVEFPRSRFFPFSLLVFAPPDFPLSPLCSSPFSFVFTRARFSSIPLVSLCTRFSFFFP